MTGHTPTSELQDGLMGGCHVIGVFADVIQILFLLEESMIGFFFWTVMAQKLRLKAESCHQKWQLAQNL